MMRNPRSLNDNLKEPWLIAPEDEDYIIKAMLRATGGGNFTFSTEDDSLMIGSRLVACPATMPYGSDEMLREQIFSHSEKVSGEVLREAGTMLYAVRIQSNGKSLSSTGETKGDLGFEEEGFQLIADVNGRYSISEFSKQLNQIKKKAASSLRILLDFGDLDDSLPTATVMIRDLIKHFAKNHRFTAVVCTDGYRELLQKKLKANDYVRFFSDKADAERFFDEDPIRVMIVEDDPATQAFTSSFLEKKGLQPSCVSSAEDCLAKACDTRPDLILMDIHLPGMSGVEAAKEIRRNPFLSKIPIIMLTSEASAEVVRQAHSCGINGYFLKPFNPDIFSKTLLNALSDAFID